MKEGSPYLAGYSFAPDGGCAPDAHPWIHIAPGDRRTVTILSANHIGAMIHWYAGRSIGCAGATCPPIIHARSARYRVYLPVFSHKTMRISYVELPESSLSTLTAQTASRKTLRGTIITIARAGSHRTCAPTLTIHPAIDQAPLPESPKMLAYLVTQWQRATASVLRIEIEPENEEE